MRSRIIYKYLCQRCRALYYNQTRRHFHTRISEHTEVSPLTGKKLATNSLSSVLAHSQQSFHNISPDNFTITSSCRSKSNFELLLRESLLISKFRPSLHENIPSIPLSLLLSNAARFHGAFHFILLYFHLC